MNKSNTPTTFPFFAGQFERKRGGQRHVLSPMPVKTNVPPVQTTEQLVQRTDQFIEVGGVGGMIFQTQLLYVAFLISLSIFLGVWFSFDSITDVYYGAFRSTKIDGVWHRELSWVELISGIGLVAMGPMMFLVIGGGIMFDARRMLSQTIPFRFHRQRREVMMSRWNEKTKKTEVRFFPWESICAMVGQGGAVSSGGLMFGSTLFIGANDEDNPGHFWAAMQLPAIHVLDAAAQWEMIRRFMDEGPEAIGEPTLLTMEGVIQEHCRMHELPREKFRPGMRVWKEINGTRFGIWRTWHETRLLKKRTRKYPEVERWSQPLPRSEWVKPSKDLNYYNRKLAENEYARGLSLISVRKDLRELYGENVPSGPQEPTSLQVEAQA